jgi:prepilin-type N-terminal cleavage/methylation domain-containing protein
MQKRKGFTLVELVIVIAVIAILAGVLIGTFASVINRANDSARLQELKAQEIEQKADDILKKIEDSGWYGWEDFETSIVEKMTRVYKESATPDQAKIKAAVTSAIEDYAKANANSKTNLTEDQVRAIVENAMGEINYSGVTEAQVKTIIETASDVKGAEVASSTVREIVEAANANNLTAPEVAKIITINIGGATASDFDAKLDAAVAAIKASQRSDADLTALIETLVPVTRHVANQTELDKAIAELQSGSTIWLDNEMLTVDFTLNSGLDQVKTFTLRGKAIGTLNVDAPKATLYVMNDITTKLNVIAIANNSLHTYGTVNNAEINAGRYVVEQGSVTGTLKAAPTANQTVTVEVGAYTSVATLEAQYQTTGTEVNNYIQIVNAGRVGSAKLTGVEGWTAGTNTTNVRIVNKAGATGTDAKAAQAGQQTTGSVTSTLEAVPFTVVDEVTATSTELATTGTSGTYNVTGNVEGFWGAMYATAFAGGDGTKENPYQISNAAELVRLSWLMLNEPASYNTKNYILTSDIDLTGSTWMPISAYSRNLADYRDNWFAGTFDGQGYSVTGLNDNRLGEIYHSGLTGKNASTVANAGGEYTFGLFGSVKGATIKNVTVGISLSNTSFVKDAKTYVGDSVGGLVGFVDGYATISNIVVNGTVKGTDGVAGIVGRWYNKTSYGSNGATTGSVKNCVNNATIVAYNPATSGDGQYTHVAGILGYESGIAVSFVDNTNNGNVTGNAVAVYIACIGNGDGLTGSGNVNNGTVSFTTIAVGETQSVTGTQTSLFATKANAK